MTSPSRHSMGGLSAVSDRPSYLALSTIRSPPSPRIRSRGTVQEGLCVPGPGTYTIHTEWKGNALYWRQDVHKMRSMPLKDLPATELSPVRSQLSSRTTSFGPKLGSTLTETPGPCTYSPRNIEGKVSPRIACTFGQGHGEGISSPRYQVPGPGTYEPQGSDKKPSITLKGRLSISSFEVPGPGQYNSTSQIGTGLAKTIGSKF